MAYELWDMESANLVGDYPTQESALADIRLTLTTYGRGSVEMLTLAYEDERGETRSIASGQALIDLADRLASVATSSASRLRSA